MRTHSSSPPFRVRLLAAAALLLAAACEREILRDEARSAGPSMVRAGSSSQEVGSFGVSGMNEAGDLVGNVGAQPYRWTAAGGLELLPHPGTSAYVYDINDSGTAVGKVFMTTGWNGYRAVVWPGDGGSMQMLPLPADGSNVLVVAINDAGLVTGTIQIPSQGHRVFRWSAHTGVQVSPKAIEYYGGTGTYYEEHMVDVSNAGDVLINVDYGCVDLPIVTECFNVEEMFWGVALWRTSGEVIVLEEFYGSAEAMNDSGLIVGCLGGEVALWNLSGLWQHFPIAGCATAVSESGFVVGDSPPVAFRWTEAGGVQRLGTLGGLESRAADVNEDGEVTGWARDGFGARRAFVWTRDAGMLALPPLAGSASSEGKFINDARVVGGDSWTGDGPRRATRWVDVVVNVPPGADAGGPYTGRISGRRYAYDASSTTDPDGTRLRFSWDMNADGTYEGVTNNPQFGYTYPAGGTYTIRLVVLDDGGRADTTETTATIAQNVAPVISTLTGMPTSRGEGLPITLTTTVSDANQAVDSTELGLMRYRWDWGDGYTSAARISTHSYADQGTYTVRLIVTDAGGLADTVVRTAVIGNLPPTGRLVAPTSIGEGTAFTISATALTDAPADLAAGFTVAFNCGGGFGAYGTATSIVCPARPDQGSVTVRMRVKDKDGAASEATRTIPVGNVAPRVTATATSPTTFAAGGTFSVSATFTDVAGDAPWRYRIYWGDGASTPLTNVAGGATITGSHAYAAPGTYTVQVAVADKDGGSGRSAPITVTVTP